MKLLTVIPTYNECENIEPLILKILDVVKGNISILVVDDSSPDGTSFIVEKLSKKYNNVHLLIRPAKSGLASAYIEGFLWGIDNGFDTFLEMDADFSHNPEYIPEMIEKIQNNDVVIGSRIVKGGGCKNRTFLRDVITRGGSFYSRLILSCPVKDLTGGFNMWTLAALEKINLNSILSKGYCFQIEMKYKAFKSRCKIVEIPIIFEDRRAGKSKMSSEIFLEAMFGIFKIRSSK